MWFAIPDNIKSKSYRTIKPEDFPKNPTTSWVIRTYNEEKWLATVLHSLFLQSRLDFEVVIVDSGSTDKTLEITKNFPIRKTIHIKTNEYNYSRALNKGIGESWGKYIGIISGHSIPVSRTWYEDAMSNFDDPKMAAVTGHYTSLPDGDLTEKLGDVHFDLSRLEKEYNCKWMTNTNAIIRKDLWEQYPFDEELPECEDYDWACEILSRGYNVVKDPAFNVWHSHGGLGRKVFEQRQPSWEKTCAMIDKKNRPSGSLVSNKVIVIKNS